MCKVNAESSRIVSPKKNALEQGTKPLHAAVGFAHSLIKYKGN